jgi:signal transduction histidine kinase
MTRPSYNLNIHPQHPNDLGYEDEHERRVLIVDDEKAVRDLFASYLGEHYSCAVAADAAEALAALAEGPFALVICDVQMPGLSGTELLRKVVERYPETAVIMVSVVERTQRVIDAVRLGAYDYLLKPVELDVLDLCVGRALERRSLLRNARRYKRDLENRNAELARRKSELERLQAQIVHSEKMASLGQLAAGVAHELNNPTGFIYANMELLRDHVAALERLVPVCCETAAPPVQGGEERGRERAEAARNVSGILGEINSIASDCHSGAARIRDVVQNLRTFSRLDEAELKSVNIAEGIESTVRLLSRYFSGGRVTLTRDYAELPQVECYAGQLNQVWMNLLANAAQAVRGEGEVRVTTRLDGQWVKVSVSDNGEGIAPEHLNKIFEPFFTTKPVGEGTGLGLSICHGIVERHGGTIKAESRSGAGATFEVTLPLAGCKAGAGGGRLPHYR